MVTEKQRGKETGRVCVPVLLSACTSAQSRVLTCFQPPRLPQESACPTVSIPSRTPSCFSTRFLCAEVAHSYIARPLCSTLLKRKQKQKRSGQHFDGGGGTQCKTEEEKAEDASHITSATSHECGQPQLLCCPSVGTECATTLASVPSADSGCCGHSMLQYHAGQQSVR